MHVQRIISTVLLAWMIWIVYSLNITFEYPFLLIIAGFAATYFLLTKRVPRNGEKKFFIHWPTTLWSIIGFIVFIFVFGLVLINFETSYTFYMSFAEDKLVEASTESKGYFILMMIFSIVVTAVSLFSFLFIVGFLLAMSEVATNKTIRFWQVPFASYYIMKKRAVGYLAKGSFAILFIWPTLLIDLYNKEEATQYICFTFLLFIMFSVINSRTVSEPLVKRRKNSPFRWIVLGAVIYITFFVSMISFIFLYGALSGLVIYFLCYAIVKMRLFIALKWLLIFVCYIGFFVWIFQMWTSMKEVGLETIQ
ncbi:hypothetical protein I6N90_12390 [Paenibacillus sp. GSMTC-2017]|uniref:hypothetical protein n=1 Tax=Paenibacillus sp. GSMTC-2017 TaxID=2794350 RepID=UPI0018D5DC64|nr:hypothetical protein [Paenibacillus sp. GSMTC-2017]MBH5318595.1 hypothetical protein [Paenibacillus sp. GSMTC-2017]